MGTVGYPFHIYMLQVVLFGACRADPPQFTDALLAWGVNTGPASWVPWRPGKLPAVLEVRHGSECDLLGTTLGWVETQLGALAQAATAELGHQVGRNAQGLTQALLCPCLPRDHSCCLTSPLGLMPGTVNALTHPLGHTDFLFHSQAYPCLHTHQSSLTDG